MHCKATIVASAKHNDTRMQVWNFGKLREASNACFRSANPLALAARSRVTHGNVSRGVSVPLERNRSRICALASQISSCFPASAVG